MQDSLITEDEYVYTEAEYAEVSTQLRRLRAAIYVEREVARVQQALDIPDTGLRDEFLAHLEAILAS